MAKPLVSKTSTVGSSPTGPEEIMENLFWIITCISITGAILNVKKNKLCFVFWITANTAWMIIDFYKGIYAQSALFVFYTILCLWGLWKWKKEESSTG